MESNLANSGKKRSNRRGERNYTTTSDQDNLEGEELIDYLENKLEDIEKKLGRSQTDYEILQENCLELQEKLSKSKEKYKRAALMLSEFLEDLLSQKPNILKDQMIAAGTATEDVDISKLQNTPIEELDRDDKIRIVYMLLQ